MRRLLVIYDFATAPFWISLYIWEKSRFLFYQCAYQAESRTPDIYLVAGNRTTTELLDTHQATPYWLRHIPLNYLTVQRTFYNFPLIWIIIVFFFFLESTYPSSPLGHSMGAGMSAIYTGVFPEKVSTATNFLTYVHYTVQFKKRQFRAWRFRH